MIAVVIIGMLTESPFATNKWGAAAIHVIATTTLGETP